MPASTREHKLSDLSKLSKVSFADDVREYILQEGDPSRSHPLSLSLDHSDSADSSGSMRIFVKIPRGENITLVVEPFYTIDYVKAKIQEKVQLSSHHQHFLLAAGDQLLAEGDRNLGDYNIQNGSTVQLLLQDHRPIAPENMDGKPLDNLSQLFAIDFKNSDENYHSYLDILGSQDDNISVLTSTTFFTTSSDISETNSQICLPDNLQDNVSILTPRTTNYSVAAKQNQNTSASGIKPPRPRSNLKNRSPSLAAQPGGKDNQASPLLSSRSHSPRSPPQDEMAGEQPFENWNWQTPNIPSLVPTENDEQLHLPPVPLPAARNIEEETLYTAVAEARVSVDCGSTLATNERSLFIKQGRCPTCGIQTHKRSGMFKKRSLSPLSNEHVLMGRCLICNPINIVTHQMVDASPLNTEDEANNNLKTADDALDEGGQWDALSVQMDSQVLGMKTEVEESQKAHPIDQPRPPPSVPSLAEHPGSRRDYDQPKLEDPTPSAPSLDYVCSESEAEDAQPKDPSKNRPLDEVEQWLLSHLPTLKTQDIEKYCQCLDEDGFDSILMLDVLEEGDFDFMKKAHRRVLAKRLRSMSCVDPPSFEDK